MAATETTFRLDQVTVNRLQEAAARLGLPRSGIVRRAILEFCERTGRSSERECLEMLRAFDELVPKIPVRPAKYVDRELAELRKARRSGGWRTFAWCL
jgi:Ribbon-helix-helix protein, copG family